MPRTDRLKLLLLLALFAAPAAAAWLAHQVWRPAGGHSYGTLLEPRVPDLAGLRDGAGQPADPGGLAGRWVLLTVADEACAGDCRQLLYLARQVRLAQGREQGRVALALVMAGAPPEVAGVPGYSLPAGTLRRLHPGAGPALYVVDPLGRVMLRFPARPDGKAMIGDLRRLLLASRIG